MTDRDACPGNLGYDRSVHMAATGWAVLVGCGFLKMASFPGATSTTGSNDVLGAAALAFCGVSTVAAMISPRPVYAREQVSRAR